MERIDFIKKFAVSGSILLTAPILFNACAKDEDPDPNNNPPDSNALTIDLTDGAYSALGTVGGFAYSGNIIIFRSSDTTFVALSKVCTHSQCTVTYNHDNNELPCPCHGSKFNTSGVVINGPAAINLKKFTVVKEGNTLKIT